MTDESTVGTRRLDVRRRYRRLLYAAPLAGAFCFAIAVTFGYEVVGVGLYWLGFLVFLGIWWRAPVSIQDERDKQLERRASELTLTLVAFVGILVWPSVVILSETRGYEPPPVYDGVFLGISALYAVFGVVYLILRYRR